MGNIIIIFLKEEWFNDLLLLLYSLVLLAP